MQKTRSRVKSRGRSNRGSVPTAPVGSIQTPHLQPNVQSAPVPSTGLVANRPASSVPPLPPPPPPNVPPVGTHIPLTSFNMPSNNSSTLLCAPNTIILDNTGPGLNHIAYTTVPNLTVHKCLLLPHLVLLVMASVLLLLRTPPTRILSISPK